MPPDPHSPQPVPTTPPRPEGGSPEVDLLEEMGKTILQSAEVLVESLAGRTPIGEGWQTIRDLEHKGDAVARDMFEMLMTPRPTLIAPDALKALTGYLDDILDAIEAAAARLAIHRIRRAIPAARELGQIVLESAQELRQALELRQNGELFVHTRTLHRLENRGDDVLRDAIGALFSRRASARDIVKWKDICEIMEASTDLCEDVANVLETILTQTGREERPATRRSSRPVWVRIVSKTLATSSQRSVLASMISQISFHLTMSRALARRLKRVPIASRKTSSPRFSSRCKVRVCTNSSPVCLSSRACRSSWADSRTIWPSSRAAGIARRTR